MTPKTTKGKAEAKKTIDGITKRDYFACRFMVEYVKMMPSEDAADAAMASADHLLDALYA